MVDAVVFAAQQTQTGWPDAFEAVGFFALIGFIFWISSKR